MNYYDIFNKCGLKYYSNADVPKTKKRKINTEKIPMNLFPADRLLIDVLKNRDYDNSGFKRPGYDNGFRSDKGSGSKGVCKSLELLRKCISDNKQNKKYSFHIIAREGEPRHVVVPLPSGGSITIGIHISGFGCDREGQFASAILERSIGGKTEAIFATFRVGMALSIHEGITMKVVELGSDNIGRYVDLEVTVDGPGVGAGRAKLALALTCTQEIEVETVSAEKKSMTLKGMVRTF